MCRRGFVGAYLCSSCSFDSGPDIKGFWVSKNGNAIFEFTDKKAVVLYLSKRNSQSVFDYEPIDSHRLHLKADGVNANAVIIMDNDFLTFSVSNILLNNTDPRFARAPNVTTGEMKGVWYTSEKDTDEKENIEHITVVTYSTSSYDYESITLHHDRKTYSRRKDFAVLYSINDGFIFVDPDPDNNPETKEEYRYYLTSFGKNKLTFIDTSGNAWEQNRLLDMSRVSIPKDYEQVEEVL